MYMRILRVSAKRLQRYIKQLYEWISKGGFHPSEPSPRQRVTPTCWQEGQSHIFMLIRGWHRGPCCSTHELALLFNRIISYFVRRIGCFSYSNLTPAWNVVAAFKLSPLWQRNASEIIETKVTGGGHPAAVTTPPDLHNPFQAADIYNKNHDK